MTADTALAVARGERAARGLSVGSFVIWSRPLTAVGRDPAHPAHDRLSALRILQRRRPHGYAHQRQRKLPPRPARATGAESGERGDVELGHLPVALSQRR